MECLPFDGEMVFLPAIERVIHDGMTDVCHVDADLVGTSCFQLALDPGVMRHEFKYTEMGDGMLAGLRLYVPFHAILRTAPQGETDDARISFHLPMDEGDVVTLRFMRRDLFLQHREGFLRLRDDHDTRGILVKAVYNARAYGILAGLKKRRADMIEECIHQCAIRIARAGMHDHAACFIDNQHVFIFVEDIKRYILRNERDLLLLFPGEGDLIACLHMVIRADHLAICEQRTAVFDPFLHFRTGEPGGLFQELVKTLSCFLLGHNVNFLTHASCLQK